MDLLKNHFPGMVGASTYRYLSFELYHKTYLTFASRPVFVLNYSWLYGGMWAVAKRILPQTVLERILFPTVPELLTFFEPEHLLQGYSHRASTLMRRIILTRAFQNTGDLYLTPTHLQISSLVRALHLVIRVRLHSIPSMKSFTRHLRRLGRVDQERLG
jgi:hypothetical protein